MFHLQVSRAAGALWFWWNIFSPEKSSTPGNCYALRFAIGTSQSNQSLLDAITVFLHPPGEFSFFVEQDSMPNSLRIDLLNLRRDQANIFTLKKRRMTNLNRADRQCEEREDYNWRTCLDHLFYSNKGCQDPWDVNPQVELPVCSNLSYILGHTYNRPPLHISFDQGKYSFTFTSCLDIKMPQT